MNSEYFSKDVWELLSVFSKHGVRYPIVSREAVIYYGYPGFTGDIDIFFEPTPENSERLWKTMEGFWGGDVPGVQNPSELPEPGVVIQFGVPPNRLDLINSIDGVLFQSAWEKRITEDAIASGKQLKIFYIGPQDLIWNNKAVSRNKDLDDLRYLETKKNESKSMP